ncbi:glycosyltransferase family 2 protein [Henriciella litoralis]|uniref:glycosyltransferase family 2 protein n=1 Tax=Henriciella litoralis TaxID=568102 RepID=UPI001F2BC92C|nr:glycosyltransferase family 2 protein [Henriciella litoralis]
MIIVNYNGGQFIGAAIDHLCLQSRPPDEVIIVDNASTDGSADALDLSRLPGARLVRMDENCGFARANNLAANMASGDWLALLNPDTEPQRDWLEQLEKGVARHPNVRMFASAQIDANDTDIIDGAGDCYFILGVPWRGGFGRSLAELPAEGECFSPCGASSLIDRATFLEVGGFEESFFCYCEDVDLGFRLRLQGQRCVFLPEAIVHHHASAITGRHSAFTIRLGTRNRLSTYLANMPAAALIATLPGHILATLYLYVRAFGKPYAKAMRHGVLEGLKNFPAAMRRRKVIQKARTASTLEIISAMSWNPLQLHGRKVHVWPIKRSDKIAGKP